MWTLGEVVGAATAASVREIVKPPAVPKGCGKFCYVSTVDALKAMRDLVRDPNCFDPATLVAYICPHCTGPDHPLVFHLGHLRRHDEVSPTAITRRIRPWPPRRNSETSSKEITDVGRS